MRASSPNEGRAGGRERQAVRGRDDEALAHTLDDEAASLTNGDDTRFQPSR